MTPSSEIAEKIKPCEHCGFNTFCRPCIAAALDQAKKEAVEEGAILCKWHSGYRRFCSTCVRECETKVRKSAFLRAAEISESINPHLSCGCRHFTAKAIRAEAEK